MPNKNIEFIEKIMKEVKVVLYTFNKLYTSINTNTYSTVNELIRNNKNNQDFLHFYMSEGFKEAFGMGMMKTRDSIFFSCENPDGKPVLIRVDLKK